MGELLFVMCSAPVCKKNANKSTYNFFLFSFFTIAINKNVTSSGKIRLMEEQKEQALIRRSAFYAASDCRACAFGHI